MSLVAVARFSSDANAICYVLPVLWMTLCFHIMQGIGRIQNVRRRAFRPVRQVAAPGRSLPSPNAPCLRSEKLDVSKRPHHVAPHPPRSSLLGLFVIDTNQLPITTFEIGDNGQKLQMTRGRRRAGGCACDRRTRLTAICISCYLDAYIVACFSLAADWFDPLPSTPLFVRNQGTM